MAIANLAEFIGDSVIHRSLVLLAIVFCLVGEAAKVNRAFDDLLLCAMPT
jgi:hypothetical protein